MNLATILTLLVIGALAVLAFRFIFKKGGNDCDSCNDPHAGCEGCQLRDKCRKR